MSASPDANSSEAQRWLRQAQHQHQAAQWSAQGKFWDNGCFQCQQAAEIALKALLIRQGERVRIHGVLSLVGRVKEYYPELERLLAGARRLDRFYIPTRYPDALVSGTSAENFDQQDFQMAEAAASEILQAVRHLLKTD